MRYIPTESEIDELIEQEIEKLRAARSARRRVYDLYVRVREWWVRMLPSERKGHWAYVPPRWVVPELSQLMTAIHGRYARLGRYIRDTEAQVDRLTTYQGQMKTNPLQLQPDLEDPDYMHRVVTGIPEGSRR